MSVSGNLKNIRSGKRDEKRRLERRRNQLEDIRNSLGNDFEGYASDIVSCNQKISSELSSNSTGGAAISVSIASEGGGSDGRLSSARSDISAEIGVVSQKISNLESEIRSLDSQIETAQQKEREDFLKSLGIG